MSDNGVRALEPAEIGAFAGPIAGHEERHVRRLRRRLLCLRSQPGCDESGGSRRDQTKTMRKRHQ